LLGEPVRYNGAASPTGDPLLARWVREGRVVSFCPEVAGGLGTPRARAERQGLRVVTDEGRDVTPEFSVGAALAWDAARAQHIRVAILKDGSPSCGSTYIYDGSFSGQRLAGRGVTTETLMRGGIRVFSEKQLQEADAYLSTLESAGS
jgi:uncharacterized protein YbbK (DUF523 family)